MKAATAKFRSIAKHDSGEEDRRKTDLIPKPFVFKPASDIPRREFLCGPAYQRGHVTLTIAAPGAGKTSLSIAEAVHLADGKTLFDPVSAPLKIWLFNGEEPEIELERRIAGMVSKHELDPKCVASNLFFNSGLDTRLMFGPFQSDEGDNEQIAVLLIKAIRSNGIDILIIDPFVSTHAEQENDNVGIDRVSKLWAQIAHEANCAIHLVHHTRKSGYDPLTAESVRGASSLVATARFVRTLTPESDNKAAACGLDQDGSLVQVQVVKSNYSATGPVRHFAIRSHEIGNGSDTEPSDNIGVIDVIDEARHPVVLVDPQHYPAIENAFRTPRRDSDQAEDWAGWVLAEVLGLTSELKPFLRSRLDFLVKNGVLHRWKQKMEDGKIKPMIGLKADSEKARLAEGKVARDRKKADSAVMRINGVTASAPPLPA